jgi:hypothetical protein
MIAQFQFDRVRCEINLLAQKMIPLVTTITKHPLTQQTAAEAKAIFFTHMCAYLRFPDGIFAPRFPQSLKP